jgi:homoserine O-acetyltransferase
MIHAAATAAKVQAAGGVRTLTFDQGAPLLLSSGERLSPLTIAFETYGALNAARSNAVLVCHPFGADQFVASPNPVTGRPGWWPRIVGSGRPIDTNRFFVVCTNVIGGSMGSSGPNAPAPDGQPYALRFPAISISDMVRAQSMLIEALSLESLFLVIGPGFGGMQALNWASAFPRRVFACATIASAARQSPQNVALAELGRQAIMSDPDWCGGGYLAQGTRPTRGAAVARAAGVIANVSERALRARAEEARKGGRFAFASEQAEGPRPLSTGYAERFDANSFLYLSRAIDGFDLAADFGGRLANAFVGAATRHALFSFSSDWRHPPEESRTVALALMSSGAVASYAEVDTDKGHESYLGEDVEFEALLTGFIDAAAEARGLALNSGGA